jgi:hypothetical protein
MARTNERVRAPAIGNAIFAATRRPTAVRPMCLQALAEKA